MLVVKSIRKMQKLSRQLSAEGTVGLVPTMGFLHEGHLSLIKRAGKKADKIIVSIFVNPAQFAPNEDFRKYPRDEKGDMEKIRQAGADVVFIPRSLDIYPDDFQTYVTVEKLTGILEGQSRPTHFRGVTTIVSKLFNIIRPDLAVFGQKDYQQAVVISRMTADLSYPIKILIAPTIREKDGLAMSSRNKYFSDSQRKEAVCLYEALREARRMVKQNGITDSGKLRRSMIKIIKQISPTAQIDYIAFTDFKSLKPVRKVNKKTICSIAVEIHGVRLIDNMKMK